MTPIMLMLILFATLVAVLVILMIYRNTLEMHEDDQLFLGAAESHMAKEQEELQRKMSKIEPMVRWVGAASAVLLLAIVGVWLYSAFNRPIT
jgi:anaerobic C4-dicarboxylate transporter